MQQLVFSSEEVSELIQKFGITKAASIIGYENSILGQLHSINIQIPKGFIITITASKEFASSGNDKIDFIIDEVLHGVKLIEEKYKKKFGSIKFPLLLNARACLSISSGGLLPEISNIGLNDFTSLSLEKITRNKTYIWRTYSHYIRRYGSIILHISDDDFETEFQNFQKSRNISNTDLLTGNDYMYLSKLYKSLIVKKTNKPFPQDPFEQLKQIIISFFKYQNNSFILAFQKHQNSDNKGISISIFPTFYGKENEILFKCKLTTRDAFTGISKYYGHYRNKLTNKPKTSIDTLEKTLYEKMIKISESIEAYLKESKCITFFIHNNECYVLNVTSLQLTSAGKFKFIKDLVKNESINKIDAFKLINYDDIRQLSTPLINDSNEKIFCKGNFASSFNVTGKVLFNTSNFDENKNENFIYFKNSLNINNFDLFMKSSAIVTSSNNSFSQTIALLFKKTAAIGCDGLIINEEEKIAKCGNNIIHENDIVTVSGDGIVYLNKVNIPKEIRIDNSDLKEILLWADEIRRNKFYIYSHTNNFDEINKSLEVGTDGILYYPIKSFFNNENENDINEFEENIVKKLKEIVEVIKDKPLILTLLDSFKSNSDYDYDPIDLAEEIGQLKAQREKFEETIDQEEIDTKKNILLNEINNKNNNNIKGASFLIIRKDILNMQMRAILKVIKDFNANIRVLIPFVNDGNEIMEIKKIINKISNEISVGAIIETQRAFYVSDQIAKNSDFVCISSDELGKNDLINNEIITYSIRKIKKMEKEKEIILLYDKYENDDKNALDHYLEEGINSFVFNINSIPLMRFFTAKTLIDKE